MKALTDNRVIAYAFPPGSNGEAEYLTTLMRNYAIDAVKEDVSDAKIVKVLLNHLAKAQKVIAYYLGELPHEKITWEAVVVRYGHAFILSRMTEILNENNIKAYNHQGKKYFSMVLVPRESVEQAREVLTENGKLHLRREI